MTFKGFIDSKRLVDRSQNFDMLQCKTITTILPRTWKKSFINGVITPVKVRRCNECNGKIKRMTCNNQVNENKEFEATLNLLKRYAPYQFRHMLPYSKE